MIIDHQLIMISVSTSIPNPLNGPQKLTAEHAVTWSTISIPASAKAVLAAIMAAAKQELVPSFSSTFT